MWLYRSGQFFRALGSGGRLGKGELAEVSRVLGPRLFTLFSALPPVYRRHGLAVYKRVKQAGGESAALLQAALLHDCGKFDPASGRHVTLPHRVAVVLLEAIPLCTPIEDWLSRERAQYNFLTRYLLFPFYLSRHHPRLGAAMVAHRGGSLELTRLIVEHQSRRAGDEMLRRLQAADDMS